MFQTFDQGSDSSASPARIAALRERLRAAGVDGFLVPRADAHQGETVMKTTGERTISPPNI